MDTQSITLKRIITAPVIISKKDPLINIQTEMILSTDVEIWKSGSAIGFSKYSFSNMGRIKNDGFNRILKGSLKMVIGNII